MKAERKTWLCVCKKEKFDIEAALKESDIVYLPQTVKMAEGLRPTDKFYVYVDSGLGDIPFQLQVVKSCIYAQNPTNEEMVGMLQMTKFGATPASGKFWMQCRLVKHIGHEDNFFWASGLKREGFGQFRTRILTDVEADILRKEFGEIEEIPVRYDKMHLNKFLETLDIEQLEELAEKSDEVLRLFEAFTGHPAFELPWDVTGALIDLSAQASEIQEEKGSKSLKLQRFTPNDL